MRCLIMTRRAARPTDTFIQPLLQVGYPRQEWTEAAVEARLQEAGIHRVDPDGPAYVHLTVNNLAESLGLLPAGSCTHIASLLPQHHDQAWVDDVLFPLLTYALRKQGREHPAMLGRPLYGLLPRSLIPFWEGKLG